MTHTREVLRAADEGREDEVRQLLSKDPALVRARGDHDVTPLHAAAEKDHLAVASLLLEAGAELEAETTWGMTPLQWAANMGSRQVGELLAGHGARQNLWSAAGLGMLEVAKSFVPGVGELAAGAGQKRGYQELDGNWRKLPASDKPYEVISEAFYVACRNGHTDVARFLLDMGADIDCRGFFQGTGLHWAAMNGHREMVEFLLSRGADKELKDEQFQSTPGEWALESRHHEIADLLK